MYLRAGVISLALLLASRVLGLMRESVQAAVFGTTAVGDLSVVMLTLPDLATAILATGALSYALLPWWAHQQPGTLAKSQRKAAGALLALGLAVAIVLWLVPGEFGRWLAPGLGSEANPQLAAAIRWGAAAVPLSLLGSLWYTRLQHERDVIGMYGMNLVHTGVVIAAMLLVARSAQAGLGSHAISWLGLGLVVALSLRLAFLSWRLARVAGAGGVGVSAVEAASATAAVSAPATGDPTDAAPGNLPHWRIWAWAVLAAGAPAALALLARTLVSRNGEGALAAFNYAWKLVELPNLLAIQLVATLAFPAFTRAFAQGREFRVQLQTAFALAWSLACAGAIALWIGALPLARLLFGWGRMESGRLAEVAHWASWGAWTLLPQALIAVSVLVLATVGRLRAAAQAYLAAVIALFLLGHFGLQQGPSVMLALVAVLAGLAVLLLWLARDWARHALRWRELAVPAAIAALLAPAAAILPAAQPVLVVAFAAACAAAVLAAAWAASPLLRAALKR